MKKTEEAFCNGITFSIPKLIPSSIQEGEQENAMYYAYVLLTPALDKLVIKIWYAPSYSPIAVKGKEIESFVFNIEANGSEEELNGYNYGVCCDYYSIGNNYSKKIFGNTGRAYDGLMLYPAVKCILVELIKSVNELNEENDG